MTYEQALVCRIDPSARRACAWHQFCQKARIALPMLTLQFDRTIQKLTSQSTINVTSEASGQSDMMVWILNWKIHGSSYRVAKYLGRGAYGEVYVSIFVSICMVEAWHVITQSAFDVSGEQVKPVALKVTKTKSLPSSRIGDMDREVFEKLLRLKHRNLVRFSSWSSKTRILTDLPQVTFFDYFQTNALTCVSMQMCHGPDLQIYMSKYRYRPSEAKRVIWYVFA